MEKNCKQAKESKGGRRKDWNRMDGLMRLGGGGDGLECQHEITERIGG